MRTFNGTTDWINFGSSTSLDNIFAGAGGTVICTVQRTGTLPRFEIMLAKINSSSYLGWSMYFSNLTGAGSDNRLGFYHSFNNAASGTEYVSYNDDVSDSRLYTVAVAYSNAAGTNVPNFWVGGLLQSTFVVTDQGTGAADSDATESFSIGRQDASSYFQGGIGYVAAFKGVMLTTDEIRAFISRPGSVTRGIVLYAPLVGPSPEVDYSGNNNVGTLTGTALSPVGPGVITPFGGM